MKALAACAPGGSETLELVDLDAPVPGTGEILVKVAACGLNPVDYKIRMGYFSEGRRYPAIYGWDVAGVVEALGAGVADFKKGDRVFYFAPLGAPGAYAEYHTVAAPLAAPIPSALSFVEAASLPLAGNTAYQALLRRAGLDPEETVVIIGAAGGVGSLAVQLAAWRGARIIGVCSTGNVEFVRALGADEVVDYTARDVTAEVNRLTGGAGADVAFDLVGSEGFGQAVAALRPHGRLVFLNAFTKDYDQAIAALNAARLKNLTVNCMIVQPDGGVMRTVARLAQRGVIKPRVDQVIPLAGAAKAHRRLETMHGRGKIVIDMTLPS